MSVDAYRDVSPLPRLSGDTCQLPPQPRTHQHNCVAILFSRRRSAVRNRSRILHMLVPIKMLLGQLPADEMLQRYSMTEFQQVKQALQVSEALPPGLGQGRAHEAAVLPI